MKQLFFAFLLLLPASAQAQSAYRDSLKAATARLALAPDSVDLRLKKARWNIELGEWEYAKNEYDIILHHQPANPAALYYRAYVNEKLGRFGFARQDYNEFLRLVPGSFEGKLGLALLDDRDGKKTQAMDEINQLVEAHPDNAVGYAARATMERDRGQYFLAAYDYSEAIVRDPANTDYILNRADVLIRLDKLDEARRDLDLLVRLGIPRASLAEFYKRLKQ